MGNFYDKNDVQKNFIRSKSLIAAVILLLSALYVFATFYQISAAPIVTFLVSYFGITSPIMFICLLLIFRATIMHSKGMLLEVAIGSIIILVTVGWGLLHVLYVHNQCLDSGKQLEYDRDDHPLYNPGKLVCV